MGKRYPHPHDLAQADLKALQGIAEEPPDQEDREPSKLCICGDCGRGFMKGEQGDNDLFCLRCEANSAAEARLSREDDDGDYYEED